MRSLRMTVLALIDAVREVLDDPQTRALPFLALGLLLAGTVFYWRAEGWTLIEALYFSVVALTTVGFGDLHPTSDFVRLVTVLYILIGVGILLALITAVIQKYVSARSS
jgi:voltage-gated potassium channel